MINAKIYAKPNGYVGDLQLVPDPAANLDTWYTNNEIIISIEHLTETSVALYGRFPDWVEEDEQIVIVNMDDTDVTAALTQLKDAIEHYASKS